MLIINSDTNSSPIDKYWNWYQVYFSECTNTVVLFYYHPVAVTCFSENENLYFQQKQKKKKKTKINRKLVSESVCPSSWLAG